MPTPILFRIFKTLCVESTVAWLLKLYWFFFSTPSLNCTLFKSFSPLWSPTTTTPQTVTAWKSYGSYCISIHWKEGIAPGNGARTVRPAAAVAAAAGPSLTPRIWRKFVWDDQTDAPRVVVEMPLTCQKRLVKVGSWSFDLLHKQQYTKFNSYSLILIQSRQVAPRRQQR